ncbi:FtsK/SpoIIIE domain-containing protein, partial [Lacticaseibacillus paracasei]
MNSGKSVLLHSLITTLTTQMNDKDMQLVLIDPKRVELIAFAKVPHLQGRKIIYEYEDALRALLNLVDVMEERYKILE